ncbi:L-idonate 5-dehydrogenase [Arsenicitalea aurantiaca]|uniref:L-idonate 5-dehydrogenase n=1 Tax=Arsenicitalea aurantiaca TaxID=1783274 RepID=A0A433X7S7_9HYPH|nr:L-idonate 5-dehydrogenase [Arsenicitalea aurantiaca]RUT30100.1 L-idonate 5-dehydrogenase [Arsenicitalea aurantiaca]
MQGVVIHGAGDLRIEPVAPVPPGPGEVRIAIRAGGICGSDLHYYHHGGFGAVRLREPMALGHEIAGTIAELGAGVSGLAPGLAVAINPSRPCGSCRYCLEGRANHCLEMKFMGSAMRFPHVQGGFAQSVTVRADQAVPVGETVSFGAAAMAEPLAVCLHAARQTGSLMGRRVLVTGAGPIGALAVAVARFSGAEEIVVTDIGDFALSRARAMGATKTLNIAENPDALSPYAAEKGHFDALFEASGNGRALLGALETLRPGATIVQLGLGGDVPLPINFLVARELRLCGTFRFADEFPLAVSLIAKGLIDVAPLITHSLDFKEADPAFRLATDKSQAIKVQLVF